MNYEKHDQRRKGYPVEVLYVGIILFLLLSLSACTSMPTSEDLVDERIAYVPEFKEFTIEFEPIESDKNYTLMALAPNSIGFTKDTIAKAIYKSLDQMGFREIVEQNGNLKDYSVRVKVLDQGVPAFGIDFETDVKLHYTFTNMETGEVILDHVYETSGLAKFSESFLGASRAAMSLGKAVKSNIFQFTSDLERNLKMELGVSSDQGKLEQKILATAPTITPEQPQVQQSVHSQSTSFTSSIPIAVNETSGEKKSALIIGNGNYQYFSSLANPASEADQLASVLTSLGFTVFKYENLGFEEMLDALADFEMHLRNTGGLALFHYGGHGVQVGDQNYLIPVDADIPDESRVRTRAVSFQEVVSALEVSRSSANIMILDACRDNPLPQSTRSGVRGLSVSTRQPPNSVVVYSAEAGTTAVDGVFTPSLIQAIQEDPTMDFSMMLRRVRADVWDKTDGRQRPGEYNQLVSDIYLSDVIQ